LEFEAKDSQTGKRLTCGAVQRSDGGPMLAASGKTRFVWFTDRDLGPGITEHVSVGVTPVPYMIVDVGGGPDATGYPVSIQYLLDIPVSTGWTDEYKTTKIPMRWIRPEVYNREGYTNDFPQVHSNYWIAVFETTQRQYEMVTGSKPATYQGPMRPVESITLAEMTNYIACLKKKTGRKFGFPDKTEWEYACRAGSTSLCYDGTSNCVRKAAFAGSGSSVDLGRYAGNCDDGKGNFAEHTNVGLYVTNAYGLYDMLGNVGEITSIIRRPFEYGFGSSSMFAHVGKNLGDYEYSSGSKYYSYKRSGGAYIHIETPHYLGFQGGNYISEVGNVNVTNVSYNEKSLCENGSRRDLTLENFDSQPNCFYAERMNPLTGGDVNGFRLFCDAE
jgi:hypothetical protein